MLFNKEYIGLALDGDLIRVAHIKKQGNTFQLLNVETHTLIEPLLRRGTGTASQAGEGEATQPYREKENTSDIFGLQEEPPEKEKTTDDDIDFEALEAEAESGAPDLDSLDMVEEAAGPKTNSILLHNILSRINNNSAEVGLNIPAGQTIYQVSRGTDFSSVKQKDLIADIESRLESIYGNAKSPDFYAYNVREDGSLILASVEEEAPLLPTLQETRELYSGSLKVRSIYPDEVALAHMVRSNYQISPVEMTAVIQFGQQSGRIFFMKGGEIWDVPGVITQGVNQPGVLNTVFSKLLFQLDTGKVPQIDTIILANNTLGEEAVAFLRQRFPEVTVQSFSFNEEKLANGTQESQHLEPYTTAIAAAWSAAAPEEGQRLSFLPSYVEERQKIFKLQWHGLLLLALIFLSIPTINYFYQANANRIASLQENISLVETQVNEIEPTVQATMDISNNLSLITTKLSLLDSLSTGSKTWSAKMDLLNQGMENIPNSWLTSLVETEGGTFLEGYTLYRNRIPAIVGLFNRATLLNVNIEEMRGEAIFRFSIIAQEFAADSSVYSPEKPESIEQILSNSP